MSENNSEWRDSIHKELAALHGRVDAVDGRMHYLEEGQREMGADIKTLLQRGPSKLPLYGQIVVLSATLAIIGLLFTPLAMQVRNNSAHLLKHDDGHPEWVAKLMAEKFKHIVETLKRVDKSHAEEHLEQEEDIRDLRTEDARIEARLDSAESDIVRLHTIADERTKRFKARLNDRASDRWTGSQQKVFESGLNTYHEALNRRISRLENLLFGGTGNAGGLHH